MKGAMLQLQEVFHLRGFNLRSTLRYLPVVAGAWYFYKLFVKPFLSPLRKIPGCPYRPIVGNLLESMRAGANNNGLRWMQKYKSSIIRYYSFGGEGTVLVGDPALAKYILVTNSKNYHRAGPNSFFSSLAPGFLALLNGEEHHSLRRLVKPVLNSLAVEGFIPSFDKTARKVIRAWSRLIEEGGDAMLVPAQDYMTRLTLDSICLCGFDYDMRAVESENTQVVRAFTSILGGLQVSFLQLLGLGWLPTKKNRQIKADTRLFKSTIQQVISSKQAKMEQGTTSKDILSLLFQARDENGLGLSPDAICSQVGGFLIAGFDTTNTSLTWTLLCLSERPDIQEKARQEVMSLLPDKDQPVTPEVVESLTYLTCVIKESLRLYTPLSTIFRRTQQDDHLNNYFIPAGTLVGINLGGLHRLPEVWSDPLTFNPERFLGEYDKYAFLPFITGPYMCIGNIFSMAETKVTLALILRHFRISLPEGYTYKVVRKLAIQPSPPLTLLVSPM